MLLDLDLLRRDEVWLINKDFEGRSSVYSLEEFPPRYDKDIRKSYLQGRFGAIPLLPSRPQTRKAEVSVPKREFADFSRIKPYRDAKSIVIATEGELTERDYFEDLALDERVTHPSVEIKVLPTTEGFSAPFYVLQRLDRIRREHGMFEGDELWLVIDKDRWKDAQLSQVAQLASQKRYYVADSNPCFELWLLIHHRSLESYSGNRIGGT